MNFSKIKYLIYLASFAMAALLVACSSGGGTDQPVVIPPVDDGGLLNWTAPSEREDGTALALSEISGYRIYYGAVTGVYQEQIDVNDLTATQAELTGVPPGTYYVVVTTIDTDGRESAYSSEVIVTL